MYSFSLVLVTPSSVFFGHGLHCFASFVDLIPIKQISSNVPAMMFCMREMLRGNPRGWDNFQEGGSDIGGGGNV